MSSTDQPAKHQETYTPGYAVPKLLLAAVGVILVALSLTKLGPVLRMTWVGRSATAEAVRVVLKDAGDKETVLVSAADVADAEKRLTDAKDRSVSLWLEYRFTDTEGKVVEARSPIGNTYKPLHPYRDADGLPSTIRIWYDPADSRQIMLPFQFLPGAVSPYPFGFGTFFVPGMVLLLGLSAFGVGLLLWRRSGLPIAVPDLSQAHGESETRRIATGGH